MCKVVFSLADDLYGVEQSVAEEAHQTTGRLLVSNKPFQKVLLSAAASCTERLEEEGGVIFEKDGVYEFEKLANSNSGQLIANVLWTADMAEYGQVLYRRKRDGWTAFASFHTHPRFAPSPSSVDTGELFPNFKYNVIWSPRYGAFSLSTWLRFTSADSSDNVLFVESILREIIQSLTTYK